MTHHAPTGEKDVLELTILMPCLNEAETVGVCVDKAVAFLQRASVRGEVLVADNGSTDGSQDIARKAGARVIPIPTRGYGAALIGGIAAARGRFVIMGDSDDSYDFSSLEPFLDRLRAGASLVMGNRFLGGIDNGAMPFLHRYLGTPVLSMIGRIFYRVPVGDYNCGLRGFSTAAISSLALSSTGMEFASEMIVKAGLSKFRIEEVPTRLRKDGRRSKRPHLKTWSDGWRHLRFLLLHSPRWLFLYPGLALITAGLIVSLLLLPGPVTIAPNVTLDVHTMLVAGFAIIAGIQLVSFSVIARGFAARMGYAPRHSRFAKLSERLRLEHILISAVLLILAGSGGVISALLMWAETNFGPLNYATALRTIIPSMTAIVIGIQIAFSAFLMSILDIPTRNVESKNLPS